MAASDSINNKQKRWATVYRGLAGVKASDVDMQRIGSHWSSDPNIAVNFALSRDVEGNFMDFDDDDEPNFGTVLEAKVHRRHLIDPESEEGQNWQFVNAVLGPNHIEREKTVRPGAPVHIQAIEELSDEGPSKFTARYMRGRS